METRKQDVWQRDEDNGGLADERSLETSVARQLLKRRTILLSGEISQRSAYRIIAQLLLLGEEESPSPIRLFINSPGGDADAGFAIFDTIRFLNAPVQTICAGLTASAAVIVLLGAPRNRRFSLPNARVLIHQPSTVVRGYVADIQIEASEIVKIREKINELIASETGQPVEKVANDTRRNFWMSAEEALQYGLVGRIIRTRDEL